MLTAEPSFPPVFLEMSVIPEENDVRVLLGEFDIGYADGEGEIGDMD